MARRRANREGTIFYDPQRKRWVAQLTPDEYQRRPKRSAATQEEARQLLRHMERERERGIDLTEHPTVASFCTYWLEHVVQPSLKAKTHDNYRFICTHYIIPAIGTIRLRDLRAHHIRRLLRTLQERGLATDTLRSVYFRLRTALNCAIDERLLSADLDPLRGIKAPRPTDSADEDTKPHQVLSAEQAQKLLNTVADHRLEALYWLALRLGLRQGELLGLQWTDINWERGTLRITGQLQQVDGQWVRTKPKTKRSRRTLYLDAALLDMLKHHSTNQHQERHMQSRRNAWQEYGYVFPSERGTPINPRNLLRGFKRLLRRAELPNIRFHDLRHTAASLMLDRDVPIPEVSAILGHSGVDITMRIYAHAMDITNRRALDATAHLFTRKRSS